MEDQGNEKRTGLDRRFFLQTTAGLGAGVVTGFTPSTARAQEGTDQQSGDDDGAVIYEQKFESGDPDTVPSDFVLVGNSDQKIIDADSADGEQAYRMSGDHGGCWMAIARSPDAADLEFTDSMVIKGYYKRIAGSEGCHSNKCGAIKFRTNSSESEFDGQSVAILEFKIDGTIQAAGTTVGNYSEGEWVEFEVEYERNRDEETVTYNCEIDGGSTQSATRDVTDFEDDLSAIELISYDFTVAWDNLQFAERGSTNTPPTAQIDVSTENPDVDEEFTLDASGSNDPDGTIESYEWDVDGDGDYQYSGETLGPITADEPGTYELTLRVTDDDGATDTETVAVTVSGETSFEVSAQTSPASISLGETITVSLDITNTGNSTGSVNGYFQEATDSTNHTADIYGDQFEVVEHTDDGGSWDSEGWEFPEVDSGETREPSVTLEVAESLETGDYTFRYVLVDDEGTKLDSAHPTVTVTDSGGGQTISRLSFNYDDFGGETNLEVNDDQRVPEDLGDLDGETVGGASVSVTQSSGEVVITGSISSFSVGGQEFQVDEFSFGPSDDPHATVEFDSLDPQQSSYEWGDTFTADDVPMSVESFTFSDGDEYKDGIISVLTGSDTQLGVYNLNLRVDIGAIAPEEPVSVQPANLRLVQTAEHTRREQYEDIVSRSALESEGALPAWAPDTELVAEKETAPVFDLELSETDTDSSLETAIDVSVSWGQTGIDDQSFTLRPEFVSDVLDPTTAVSSVLDAFVDGFPRPSADGETYPVVELPADLSDVEVTVSPQSENISGKTAALTDVSTVETGSLNVGMVLLSDTEDATEYDEVDVVEFEQEAAKQRDAIEQFLPASTVNVQILTDPVALKGTRLRDLLPYWDYRERHQRLAWEYAREELGDAIDSVVAFSPPNFLADNSEAGGKGVTTVGECEQAVLVDMGLSDTTTAAHELTHYFLDTYTAETEYEAEDDDGSSDGAHMSSDIVSTTVETPDTGGIPLDNGPVEFDNFETPNSYMQSSSLSSANQDTITAQALLDNGKNGGFTCAWGTPDETSGSVVSVSASVTADGIDVHSTRKSDVLSPSTDPDGDAKATIQDANGETIDSLSLSTIAPETYAMGGDGNCCTSSAAQDETIIRGRIPFSEDAASIALTAPNPDKPAEDVSTDVDPVTETFREQIAALPDTQFETGVDPEATRQSYLDRLDSATTALNKADYEAATNQFETLRGEIQTEVHSDYEPPAGIPSQQDLLDEVADRLNRIDRLQEDAEGSPDDPTVADYTNENGIVDTQGLQTAIGDLQTGNIDVALLRDVMTAWQTGNPVN